MKKRIIGLMAVLMVVHLLFAGCGAGAKTSVADTRATTAGGMEQADYTADVTASKSEVKTGGPVESPGTAETTAAAADGRGPVESPGTAETTAAAADGNGNLTVSFNQAQTAVGASVSNPILDQRKVIRSANITVEVDNFDTAYGKINSSILGIGFIQETNINTGRVYVEGAQKLVKHGTIVVRVDRDKFDKVVNGMKEIGVVLQFGIQGEDVTEKYFDTESRLKLLRLEEERVIEYLKKLDNPDKIITYESRLTGIRQEIESLTGTLRKLSDLVDLSTITVTMSEKYPGSDKPVKEKTYWDQVGDKFTTNMKGVINFCGDLIIFIISALPVLVLLALLAWLIFVIYRKISRYLKSTRPERGVNYPEYPAEMQKGSAGAEGQGLEKTGTKENSDRNIRGSQG